MSLKFRLFLKPVPIALAKASLAANAHKKAATYDSCFFSDYLTKQLRPLNISSGLTKYNKSKGFYQITNAYISIC